LSNATAASETGQGFSHVVASFPTYMGVGQKQSEQEVK